MESPVEQCHLLRISRELRHCIYDQVTRLDPPSDTVWQYKNSHNSDGFNTTIIKAPDTNFSIPWVNLLLTCKSISTEIIAFLDIGSSLGNEERRTWNIELTASDGGALRPALWRQIPCHPARAEILVANIGFASESTQFWGCGGPMSIVRNLYQTLNRILHYGPAFGRQIPLSQPLRLKTLVLRTTTCSSRRYVDTHPDGVYY
jgi:hypothetical protein